MKDALEYLALRLRIIDCAEADAAIKTVERAVARVELFESDPMAAHALYRQVAEHLSQAMDHCNFERMYEPMVNALYAEVEGRSLVLMLQHGWIKRSDTGPTEFPPLHHYMG